MMFDRVRLLPRVFPESWQKHAPSLAPFEAAEQVNMPQGHWEFRNSMTKQFTIRPIHRTDYEGWRLLWDGYNAFYGRSGPTALPEEITQVTWERFFNHSEPVYALVAEEASLIVGLAHYLFHRSTTRMSEVCYLQDLFTDEQMRGRGIARQLINAVYEAANTKGCSRVYWQTQTTNTVGRALYDKVAEHRGFIVYTHEL